MVIKAQVLLPSLALFWSFLLLGIFVSALGPAVPSLSRHVGVSEVAFGRAFSLRGLGYLLGSYASSLTLPWGPRNTQSQSLLNNRMIRLGMATAGMGLFAVALDAAATFMWVCVWCFLQGFCGGAIDAISNTAISALHGEAVAPWMQGLHFCFSAGALIAPAAMGQLGYRTVLVFCGFLALPGGISCCLAGAIPCSGDEGDCSASSRGTKSPDAETKQDESPIDIFLGEIELVEAPRGSESGEQGAIEEDDQKSRPSAPVSNTETGGGQSSSTGDGISGVNRNCSVIVSEPPFSSQNDQLLGGADAQRRDQSDLNVGGKEEETAVLLSAEGVDSGGNPSPLVLVGLLVLFLFLYVGAEVGFGAWVAVVVLRDGLATEAVAALLASSFWGGITGGRLLAVPLAVRFSTDSLMKANLVGCLLSSAALLVAGQESLPWAAIGGAVFGLSMASIFPLAMSLLPSSGYALSDKDSSRMVIGGALGEMVVPAFIAWMLGPKEGGWPVALYAVCITISVLMVGVYGVWCSLARVK